MRLPSMSAKNHRSSSFSVGRGQEAEAGLAPAASLGCYQRCAGGAAATCSECGSDPDCWDSCAGPGVGACISRCTPNYY